jgi:nickel/cobalt transporter (NicO) family protein
MHSMTPRLACRLAVLAVFVVVLLAIHDTAFAANPFGVGTPETRGIAFTGPLGGFFMWIAMRQAAFYKLLTGALTELKQNGQAFWLLGGVSFLYGIFHAAGPGHGKAVITSYLLVSRQTVRRGILIAFAAALAQGITAIAIVLVAAVVLKATSIGMTKATDWLEIMSYALVALVGAWLLWAKLTGRGHTHAHGHASTDGGHVHCDHHHHDHAHGDAHAEQHDHHHDHAHAPDPKFLAAGPLSLSRAWSAVLAVGVRPCSGAIIILVFALSQHLLYAGIASVAAMSLGTAITVSLLVVLAVSAKDLALRFVRADSQTAARVVNAFEVAAALAVLFLGLTLLGGAVASGTGTF